MERPKIVLTDDLIDSLKTLVTCEHDEYGREIPNPVPLFQDVDIEIPLTLQERIQRCLRQEFSRQAYDQGFESIDEANDFDIDEDFDSSLPVSPYEMKEDFMPEIPDTPQQPPVQGGTAPVPDQSQVEPVSTDPDPEPVPSQ